jgi:acetylornithine deacetylase
MPIKSAATEASRLARKLLRPLHNDLRSLLRALVRQNTVAIPPNGNEIVGQRVLSDFFSAHALRAELYDVDFILESKNPLVCRKRNYAGRKNLSLRLEGTGRGRSLLLNGHMDTVPPGSASWSVPPWSGRLRKGRIHGLGTFDMKGGLVANAAVVCALNKAGIKLGGDVQFESVVDEEWGGRGGTLAARLRESTADACVIPEGTQLEIYRATRGGFFVDLVVNAGNSDSYFSASEVVSPAIPLGRLLGWVGAWVKKRAKLKTRTAYSGIPDPAPVQVLAVEANRLDPEIPFSVPIKATARVYFQFVPDENIQQVISDIERSLKSFAASDPFFSKYPIQWSPLLESPLQGQELPLDHPWLECMSGSAATILGKMPIITAAPYPCDAGLIQGEFGIPTLLFGPIGGGAHNPDEYVDFESVIQTAEVILGATLLWASDR